MKTTIFVLFFLGIFAIPAASQKKNRPVKDDLQVVPSGFRLQAENVSYAGEECTPSDEAQEAGFADSKGVIKAGNDVYYEGHMFWAASRGEGLIKENPEARTCRVFPLSRLADAGGWDKNDPKKGRVPDSTRQLFRVGKTLWMGSNGIGAAVYDLERKTWSRFDSKSNVIPGDHLSINYADDDYIFITRGEFPGALIHIYSVRKNKWLGLKAVSTKLVSEYGFETANVQVPVDHRFYSKSKFLEIDWTFMGLTAKLIDGNSAYLFEKKFSSSKTVFKISKSQLERVFQSVIADKL